MEKDGRAAYFSAGPQSGLILSSTAVAAAETSMSATPTFVRTRLVCLVLLLSAQATGLNCKFLKLQQRRFNRQSVELLKGMSTKLPQECLRKMPAFSSPTAILEIHQPWAATKVILEMLHGFLNILSDGRLWNAGKATLQKRFLNMLYAQTQSVQRCLKGEKVMLGKTKEEWKYTLRLKKYFRSIRNFLEENGLDTCAQQIVKNEIQVDFVYIDRLTKRMTD